MGDTRYRRVRLASGAVAMLPVMTLSLCPVVEEKHVHPEQRGYEYNEAVGRFTVNYVSTTSADVTVALTGVEAKCEVGSVGGLKLV